MRKIHIISTCTNLFLFWPPDLAVFADFDLSCAGVSWGPDGLQTWFVLHMDSFHVRVPSFHPFSSLFFNMVFLYLRSSENFSGSVVSVSLAAFSFSSTSDHQRTRFRHFSLRPRVLTLVPFQRLKHWGCSVWTLVSHSVLLYTVRHTRVWGPRLLLFGFPNVTAFCPNLGLCVKWGKGGSRGWTPTHTSRPDRGPSRQLWSH